MLRNIVSETMLRNIVSRVFPALEILDVVIPCPRQNIGSVYS